MNFLNDFSPEVVTSRTSCVSEMYYICINTVHTENNNRVYIYCILKPSRGNAYLWISTSLLKRIGGRVSTRMYNLYVYI